MTLPFRNTDKVPRIYPVNTVVSLFDIIEDAEAAIRELDEAGFGEDLVYARGESARKLDEAKNQGWLAHLYRAMQAVMTDEFGVIKRYEKKIADGSSFIIVPLSDPKDVGRVEAILKAHNVTLGHFLGRTGFRALRPSV